MTALWELTAAELLACFRRRRASPVEAVRACVERVDATDRALGAMLTMTADAALGRAAVAERRWRDGSAGPLEGVPYGLKDLIATAGVRTTGGSRRYQSHIPTADATVVERLRASGAILLGKLQTTELASGGMAFGVTRNPWDLDRMPGGSSTGPAAAVAAGQVPLALGTDTGGSARVPAAFCGLTALKPTYGLVSRHGVMPISWTLDHVAPMARSVEDVALCLAAVAGPDERDPTSSLRPPPADLGAPGAGVRGLRVGLPTDWFLELCDGDVADACHAAGRVLVDAGAVLHEVPIPALRDIDPIVTASLITAAECASLHEEGVDELESFTPQFARHIVDGLTVPAVDYLRALRLRHTLQLAFESVFERVDVLLVPGAVAVAPRFDDGLAVIGDRSYPWLDVITRTTRVWNLLGVPALALPAGLSRDGLPIGIQLVARPHADTTCLQAGAAYQRATPHHRLRPPLPPGP